MRSGSATGRSAVKRAPGNLSDKSWRNWTIFGLGGIVWRCSWQEQYMGSLAQRNLNSPNGLLPRFSFRVLMVFCINNAPILSHPLGQRLSTPPLNFNYFLKIFAKFTLKPP